MSYIFPKIVPLETCIFYTRLPFLVLIFPQPLLAESAIAYANALGIRSPT